MKTQGRKGCEKNLTSTLSIIYRDIDELHEDPRNARVHSKKQILQISKSIEVFGFNVPLLVDSNSGVIAGHGRLAACKLLGLRQVPTISLDHLSELQIHAFMIADNRLTENATWNVRLLGEQLQMLSEVELDFDLEITGFDIGEIDFMIENLAPADSEDDTCDALADVPSVEPIAQRGDLWLLDPHRIVCGDAVEGKTYSPLLNGERASAVFTDPPYNDAIDGYVKKSGTAHHS